MRIVCVSDTHMAHRGLAVPEGDVLVHAGDATSTGTADEVDRFLGWFSAQKHPHKILIAGNHDWLFQQAPDIAHLLLEKHQGISYLQDSGVVIEGVRFWGSPWQPWFCDWAFNLPRKGQRIREARNQIPMGTDVLVTHCPPHGILDQVHGGEHLGCEELAIRLAMVKPRVHLFGHIHDSFGVAQSTTTTYINACVSTESYKPANPPIVVDLSPESIQIRGVGDSLRKQRLETVKGLLRTPTDGPTHKVVTWLKEEHIEGMKAMAELRGTTPSKLLQEYAIRGLGSDLTKHLRAEGKSSHRSVPFMRLEEP